MRAVDDADWGIIMQVMHAWVAASCSTELPPVHTQGSWLNSKTPSLLRVHAALCLNNDARRDRCCSPCSNMHQQVDVMAPWTRWAHETLDEEPQLIAYVLGHVSCSMHCHCHVSYALSTVIPTQWTDTCHLLDLLRYVLGQTDGGPAEPGILSALQPACDHAV